MTHLAHEAALQQALDEVRRLDVVELGHVAEALGVTVQRVLERMEG